MLICNYSKNFFLFIQNDPTFNFLFLINVQLYCVCFLLSNFGKLPVWKNTVNDINFSYLTRFVSVVSNSLKIGYMRFIEPFCSYPHFKNFKATERWLLRENMVMFLFDLVSLAHIWSSIIVIPSTSAWLQLMDFCCK